MTLVEQHKCRALTAQIVAKVKRKMDNDEYVARRLAAINGGDWWTIKNRWHNQERAAFRKLHPDYDV